MWDSSGTRNKEEESNPLHTFRLSTQAFSRVGGNFAPKREKIDYWKA